MSLSSALLRNTFKSSPLDESIITLRKNTIGARKASIKAVKVFRKKDTVATTVYRKERRLSQLFRFRQERRQRESILESSRLPGSGVVASTIDKGKGFLGRIMNALGYLLLGWIVNKLPQILSLIDTLKVRIGNIISAGKRMLEDVRNILVGMKGVVVQQVENIKNLDFQDSEGKLQAKIDELNASFDSMGANWNDAVQNFQNITVPPGEEEPQTTQPQTTSGGYQAAELTGVVKDRVGNDPAFLREVTRVAKKYKIKESDLLGVMAAESGLDPKAGYPNATGLIQFYPSTAAELGTSVDELYRMSRAQQMKYVDKFFEKANLREGANGAEIYATVFAPNIRGKDDPNTTLYKSPSREYADNAPLDLNSDGKITVAEMGERLRDKKVEFNIGDKPAVQSSPQQQIPPPAPQPQPQTAPGGLLPLKGTTGRAYAPQGKGAKVSVPTSPILRGRTGDYTPVITSGMGMRDLGDGPKMHNGVDIGASTGTPLFSYLPGKVYQIGRLGTRTDGGYGNWVTWKDDKFNAYHFFGHMNKPTPLRKGQKFNEKTLLGTVGGSGFGQQNKYAPHLHWEISNNAPDAMGNFRPPTDPISWMNANMVKPVQTSNRITPGQSKNPVKVTFVPIPIQTPQSAPASSSGSSSPVITAHSPNMLNKLGNIQLAYI